MLALAACDGRTAAVADPSSVAALDAATLPGPETVGWKRIAFAGKPMLLFYPAGARGDGLPAPYSDPLARRFGPNAAADLAAANGPARHGALVRKGAYPLVLFAPGAGLGSADYRWLLAGLASRGMIVAGLDPDGSSAASEARVAEARDALIEAAGIAGALATYGKVTRIDLVGHSIGGAAAVAALGALPGARAVDLDGDFLGASKAPAGGPVLLISGRNPKEPARAEARRTADWQLVSAGQGRRISFADLRHLGVTDAALLPPERRTGDLGPHPAAMHRAIGDAIAAFLLKGR